MTSQTLRAGQASPPSRESTASYWHREPDETLYGHRTTKDLPAKADVVIVGSGITGAFAAKFLRENWAKEKKVLMLEAREACWGATGRVSRGSLFLPISVPRYLHVV
jgi:FAD dependent oxidoreductase